MADTPKSPKGRTKAPANQEPKEPTAIGDDQYAGWNRGENFQPRNAGDLEDSIDRAAARVAQDINRGGESASGGSVNPGPSRDTSFEARTERGEEWEENADTDPLRNKDINEDLYRREAPSDEPDTR
jgi:hypothetical protein